MKALVVEDDIPTQKLYAKVLGSRGWDVTTAESAEQALETLPAGGYGIALLDWILPGISGLELCQKLRTLPAGKDTVVLIVTGRNEADSLNRVLDAGADDYIRKPVRADLLEVRLSVAERLLKERQTRSDTQQHLKQSEERYALAAAGSTDALWDWDLESGILYLSPRWRDLTGLSPDSAYDKETGWFSLIHPDDRERVELELKEHLNGNNDRFECDYRVRHAEGEWRWVLSRGLVFKDESGKPLRIAGSHTDLTRRGMHDSLTGLPNRALFIERLRNVFERQRRRGDVPFAILFIDLDRFKMINDSLGHAAGDDVLTQIAQILCRCVRAGDYVSRFGGDEFAILLEPVHGAAKAEEVAERIIRECSMPLKFNDREVYAATSIGIVMSDPVYQSVDELLRDADTAMYQAKSLGRGRMQVFEPALREAAQERMRLATDLRKAVSQHGFTNYYQPIVTLGTREIRGFETLARWYHPDRGYIPPTLFIKLAEDLGLIGELGIWIFREACRQFREWQNTYGEEFDLYLSVNLATRQLSQPDLIGTLRNILDEYSIPPGQICLEVTESMVIEDIESVSTLLENLKKLGVKISMDDFGTGYSSLKNLHDLPIDVLKIDQSFVGQIGKDWETTEIVRAIIELGNNLDIDIIAEGVSTELQEQMLASQGCRLGQGYLFSMPLDPRQTGFAIERQIAERRIGPKPEVPLPPG